MSTKQPDNFGFGEDETMLRDSARKFFTDNCGADKLHALVAGDFNPHRESECNWDRDLWRQVVELGWTAACIPERAAGIGMPRVAAVALAEEAGRVAFPSPLLATFMASFVLEACHTAAADQMLEAIAMGKPVTLAIADIAGSPEEVETDVRVGADGCLSGSVCLVQDARKCDALVVSAGSETGTGLYLVDLGAEGVEIVPDHIIDLTRDQASIRFDGAAAIEVGAPGSAKAVVEAALPAILCVLSADMVGAGEWLLQTTVEYARTRIQFDRPIGFFQAVKHPLVNVMIEIDDARSLTYNAACAADVGADHALRLARMAKSRASDMAVFSASRAVQFHGGIGFTWECYVHLFFKRQMHSQTLLGDGRHHRHLLAEELISSAA
ncbi:MAG: acyl-CoA dehydrogenase family protein [Pseudomonadales bacterium]|jgi:alkylation response protein AidB-like acyl-CoA dehydrogenase|nr:acyl-CoA dehydrogenase family protein [Pseudomonadales bacterium]MDP6472454.1 acyl-CoA dehydrogenase family protein [Pseudomonadales bacterium]MDP6828735.1 acyl-CoA dehydrogenase family protein [Pseudomonadales bacterium]MDP6971468.1 acyl-CoA dehydrogenase family protein [Pseudomonadales bacterium]